MQCQPDEDIELGLRKGNFSLLEGYPTVAQFISHDSDAFIYRSFQKLSARRLLYLQSQLADLEAQLERLDTFDAENQYNIAARKAAGSWAHYSGSNDGRVQEHRALQISIGKILTEYRQYNRPPRADAGQEHANAVLPTRIGSHAPEPDSKPPEAYASRTAGLQTLVSRG